MVMVFISADDVAEAMAMLANGNDYVGDRSDNDFVRSMLQEGTILRFKHRLRTSETICHPPPHPIANYRSD